MKTILKCGELEKVLTDKEVLKIIENQEVPPCYNIQVVQKLKIGIYLIITTSGGDTEEEKNAFLRFCKGLKETLEDIYKYGLA